PSDETYRAQNNKHGEDQAQTEAQPTTPHTTTSTPTTAPKPQATKVAVTESEFKIALASTSFKAGKITFDVKNTGKLAHDLAIKSGQKTKLIQPGGSAQLAVTLKPGKYHLYCSVPGHEQAGMKADITVSPTTTTAPAKTTTAASKPQAATVAVTEKEFKIAVASTSLTAGKITFD